MRSSPRELSPQEIQQVTGAAYATPVEGGPFPLVPAPPDPWPSPGPGNRPLEQDAFTP